MNHVAGRDKENFLLHVTDSRRREKWLVDGGAIISIVPPSPQHLKAGPIGEELRAANGSRIPCYGTIFCTLAIGGQDFPFEFTVAAVSQRIIGADFLANFHLAPNHRDAELLSLKDFSKLPAQHAVGAKSTPVNFVTQADDPYYQLLDSYPEILKPSFIKANPAHGVKHHIPTQGAPVQSRARRLDQEKLAVAKAELNKLVELGICHKGRSAWSSPLLVTTKPCGGWRVCGDYRRLNAMTEDDQYPVRQLTDFTSELHGKTIFSKIDLLKGYHQIPVAEEDVGKTAVITPFGLYVFPCTPFGLKNAGQDFQRLMDEILGDIPRVFVYIDDILVASDSMEQHLADLDIVFKTLAANGMVVQRPKCVLGKPSLEFLGYQVDSTGISPLKDRVSAIEQTTPPTSIKELQRFLGMIGYYRRFIPNAATHLFHLFNALKGKPKTLVWTAECQKSFDATKTALAEATLLHHPRPGAKLALTTDASNQAIGGVLEQLGEQGWEPLAFWSAKLEPNQMQWPPYDRELLAAFRGTRHFRSWIEGRPFTLFTDHQSLVPSIHKKTDPQTLRQTYQLSCVAEFTTDIRYVEGKSNVVADALSRPNEEVVGISNIGLEATSPRLEGLSTTSRPDSPNSFPVASRDSPPAADEAQNGRSGITTSPSDVSPSIPPSGSAVLPPSSSSGRSTLALSEKPPETPSQTNNWSECVKNRTAAAAASAARNEAAISDLNCVVAAIGQLGLDWEEIAAQQALDPEFRALRADARTGLSFKSIDIGARSIMADFSNGPARPYIPFASRRKVFDCFHGLGHPGVERTRKTISEKVVWPSMRNDVTKWARECLPCQQSKVIRHVVPPVGQYELPNRRFEHINIDIVTFPESNGFKYLLTMVDRFTRWPAAVPLVDMTTQSVIDGFAFGWVQHFGVPSTITSDNGTQFTSGIFRQLTQTWGIKTITTAPYHPEANGLVERLHRRLKEALKALGADSPQEWFWRLPMVMLSIRTTFKPDIGASPSDLVYGEGLAVPGELLPSNPSADPQLALQRESALADLRLEVARLQPVPTSAHRQPLVHLPEELDTCTHIFVRRKPNQENNRPLSAPYVGPFRVVSRNHLNFKVAIPGRVSETVAISRVKPAFSSFDDAEAGAPPPPRPPGRPPRQPPRPPQPQSPPVRRRVPRGRARPLPSDDEDEQPPPLMQPQSFADTVEHPLDYEVPVDEIPEWEPPPWFDADANRDWSDEAEAEAPPPPPSLPPTPPRRQSPQPAPRQQLFVPPPPPPPPPRHRRKKRGNPNWVKGGSFAGRTQRNFARPEVAPGPEGDDAPEAPQSPPEPSRRWRDPDGSEPAVTRQRRRPDMSFINALMTDHLGIPTSPRNSFSPHLCTTSCDEINFSV